MSDYGLTVSERYSYSIYGACCWKYLDKRHNKTRGLNNNVNFRSCTLHAMLTRHLLVCGLSGSTIFIYIMSQTARFSEKKNVEYKMCWIKLDQLDVTRFIISLFTAQHVSNVSKSIFRSLRLIVDLFHVLYFSGSMCIGVTVWFGWVVWYPYDAEALLTFETFWALNGKIIKRVTSSWSSFIQLSRWCTVQ